MIEIFDPFRDWDAAYVLGALSADDRRAFERHLAGCAACTSGVAELAGIPGMLSKIGVDAAVALVGAPAVEYLHDARLEPDLVQKLSRAAVARQRRTRRVMIAGMALAAGLLLVVGIFSGSAIHSNSQLAKGPSVSDTAGTAIAMSQIGGNVMTAKLRVTSKPWGTRFDWSCDYGNAPASDYTPQAYDLVVTDASGHETTVATWSATGPKASGLSASSGVPMKNIRTVEIRVAGTGTPLVRGQV
jgi:hypothetical protein